MKAIKFSKIRVGDEIVLVTAESGWTSTHHGVVTRSSLFQNPPCAEITLNGAYSTEVEPDVDVVVLINRPKA